MSLPFCLQIFYQHWESTQHCPANSIMSDLRQDDNLETDDSGDFSLFNSRLQSFRNSYLPQQVSAERLARAGFYFTGAADRVRCFSCKKTVENWHTGDRPVERHKEVVTIAMINKCTLFLCCHFIKQ